MKRLSEEMVEGILKEMIEKERDDMAVSTFSEDGVLTMNKGLVLDIQGGQRFYLTIGSR